METKNANGARTFLSNAASISTFIPKGWLTIARRFIAGTTGEREPSPEGTAETDCLSRPFGTYRSRPINPALKRRAIVVCPSGTESGPPLQITQAADRNVRAPTHRAWKNFALLSVLLLASLIAGTAPAAEHIGKLKVLVVTGGHGFEQESFFKMFTDNPDITFTPATQSRTNATVFEREDLLNYDAVLLYDMVKDITDVQKEKFLSLLDKGIGLVVLHHALVSYQHWPDYERIIGGRYPEENGKSGVVTPETGYQHDVEIPVTIVARDHPITVGLKDFTIHDEIYWGFRTQSDITPLITTTHPKSGKPLAWFRTQGKSRVVYIQLGHDHSAYDDPNYRKLLANSIRWAGRQ
jgi:uncharacterized protein